MLSSKWNVLQYDYAFEIQCRLNYSAGISYDREECYFV